MNRGVSDRTSNDEPFFARGYHSCPDVSRRVGRAGASCACLPRRCFCAGEATPTDMLTGNYREGAYPDWLKPQQWAKFLSKTLLALWAR